MSTSTQPTDIIANTLDGTIAKGSIAGMVFVAVDKSGDLVSHHCAGKRGKDSNVPMDLDTVFWIASCTKLITGIACMQLVEQGKISLDDSESLYAAVPELKEKKVLENGKLVDKKREITLRMLLDHTAGFGYAFFDRRVRDYGYPAGIDEFSGDASDILDVPLVNQPGEVWEYGTNIDWAGLAVECLSGLSLNDYFHKHIFEPLGLKNVSMLPTDEMKKNLAIMQQKYADGSLTQRNHLLRRSLTARTPEERARIFNSGGAGCFAKPIEYCQILATLLNNGTSPKTGAQILSPSTVDTMFTNSIPSRPDFARGDVVSDPMPILTNPISEMYPIPDNPPQGWGLTFMLTNLDGKSKTWRGRCTGHWAGIANLFYWVDREKGIAGMIASQTLPFADADVLGSWFACEKAVYEASGRA
ncbi:beta-lactamase/transpeptidase-like protein [Phyllosticta citrichinensis]|uniref:Beta-lactamase/transpeptidase-like protein n=1 Tax=Phyllosticta citrichinensis TaxID=1130410 RepID=A0ABR1XZV0_9PEZI